MLHSGLPERLEVTMSDKADRWKGVVRGRTILLDGDPGLPDGAIVTVTVESSKATPATSVSDGLRRAFGASAQEGAELDHFLEWNRQHRRVQGRSAEA